ncbi:hypothetical protein BpHYR1_032302 [Brachionus plicatilis]|uniref:Uncharacterized protein n=1 Tax=Brachionus plicatilis TaxID=10195 RepID=A0A3M7Q6H2_BRAPC|nr:hypothetical protein BpHYR1_032302 [Brachionus plicatilis]
MYLSFILPRFIQSGLEAIICGCLERKSYHQSTLGLPFGKGFFLSEVLNMSITLSKTMLMASQYLRSFQSTRSLSSSSVSRVFFPLGAVPLSKYLIRALLLIRYLLHTSSMLRPCLMWYAAFLYRSVRYDSPFGLSTPSSSNLLAMFKITLSSSSSVFVEVWSDSGDNWFNKLLSFGSAGFFFITNLSGLSALALADSMNADLMAAFLAILTTVRGKKKKISQLTFFGSCWQFSSSSEFLFSLFALAGSAIETWASAAPSCLRKYVFRSRGRLPSKLSASAIARSHSSRLRGEIFCENFSFIFSLADLLTALSICSWA